MKKLLAFALTLVMTLGLVGPALAAEETDPVQLLEELGVLDPVPPEIDPDFTYDGDDYDYIDPYEEYAAAHPEELANLDADALLAGWGYHDMTAGEVFWKEMYYYDSTDMTAEDLANEVRIYYLGNRLFVQSQQEIAEQAKVDYPEAWATFDADSYFEYYQDMYASSWWNCTQEEYMARENILTKEEFVDVMFADCAISLDWREPNWWLKPDPIEPTLALTVNGVVTDVDITAGEGATYADAADLRGIFGEEAVPAGKTGLLPIRETAEQAGWEVQWYDDRFWTGDQEVQLWDKAAYEAALAEEFGPLNDFFAKAMKTSGSTLFSETPVTTHQTIAADLTRFSTLDGDENFHLTFDLDATMGGGVLDATLAFDVTELLKLFPNQALESLTKMGGFSVTQLRQFLKAGVMEFIMDYNTGDVAYNIPLLALVDESLAGWQTDTISGLDGMAEAMESLEEFSFTSTLYAQMLSTASYMGAEYALSEYDQTVGLLSAFAGKDRFATRGGKTTYSITTQAMNEAISALINADADEDTAAGSVYSIFKAFDITYTLDGSGNVTADLHIRPDTDGIATAIAKFYESSYYGDSSASGLMEIAMNWALKAWNMDLTASSQGNAQRSTGTLDIHWNNVGKLSVRTTAMQTDGKAPRNVEDVIK